MARGAPEALDMPLMEPPALPSRTKPRAVPGLTPPRQAATGSTTSLDAAGRAEREVAEADEMLRQWNSSKTQIKRCLFDLIIQPVIGGEEAAITVKDVTADVSVRFLQGRVHEQMKKTPARGVLRPDQQLLVIVSN
eukprot:COSAG02_NODE_19930_length_857_cov_2.787599_1_plen_135_part_10